MFVCVRMFVKKMSKIDWHNPLKRPLNVLSQVIFLNCTSSPIVAEVFVSSVDNYSIADVTLVKQLHSKVNKGELKTSGIDSSKLLHERMLFFYIYA